jgi:hypothetical protein
LLPVDRGPEALTANEEAPSLREIKRRQLSRVRLVYLRATGRRIAEAIADLLAVGRKSMRLARLA